eukprot:TRINITY_DN528_c3_g1_i1.p1 TRINITY_DN528_c3_g1~~TRINITY_DN528_c3_g1_i1.p1  ORF type:complete len:264 (-),score=102.24 TRINITY_DN528_c3_g1_i1:180-971(-)
MRYLEYRIALPMTTEEYRVGQLYSVAKSSNQETKGDTGVEVKVNEPYEKDGEQGQYTHKIYHLGSHIPGWLAAIVPANALIFEEKSWNAFPYCKTVFSNPMLGERLTYSLESKHYDDDWGEKENVFKLDSKELKKRVIKVLDISQPLQNNNDELEENPATFKSEKTGRGELSQGWEKNSEPVMCCYKLVKVEFKWWGLQNKVENYICGILDDFFLKFYKQIFCWIDEWFGMTMDDIREYELQIAEEIKQKIEEQGLSDNNNNN